VGGLSADRFAGLDYYPMTRFFRLALFLGVGLLLGGSASFAFAGYAQLKPPSNVGGAVGSRSTAGAVAANNGQFSAGMTTSVGATVVTVPALWSFAANAGQFALGAVRATPVGLIGGAVAAWLLGQGISYLNGQFMKQGEPEEVAVPDSWEVVNDHSKHATASAAISYVVSKLGFTAPSELRKPRLQGMYVYGDLWNGEVHIYNWNSWWVVQRVINCPAGTTLNGTQCIGVAVPVPAEDADFAPLAQNLPDAVANELSGKGVPLPLNPPALDPDPITVPLSDPYPKPDGSTARKVAEVVPFPDGEKARIEVKEQPLTTPEGVPVDQGTPQAAPTDKPDFCVENPDALACWTEGEPEDSDTPVDSKNVAISPDAGWGPASASCPADLVHTLRTGQQLKLSWKPVCDGALMFRPVVIGMAWLTSVFAFLGIARKAQS